MAFKIYGYAQSDKEHLLELQEVTICICASQALALSDFFAQCAQEMKSNSAWEHEHFRGGENPDLIVFQDKG